jgi:hypothetical protein
MKGWDQDRIIRVLGIAGIPAKNVVDFLNFWGPIEDFVYLPKKDGAASDCHALMRYV